MDELDGSFVSDRPGAKKLYLGNNFFRVVEPAQDADGPEALPRAAHIEAPALRRSSIPVSHPVARSPAHLEEEKQPRNLEEEKQVASEQIVTE